MSYVIEMLGIRKEFPGIVANDDITLQVEEGEIHAILGENGAGKSTLMSILFGLYHADKGTIRVRGREVDIKSPNDAFDLGIGMVHQHFQLVHNFTVAENIIMGKEGGFVYDIRKASRKIKEISERYGLSIEPDMVIEDITVGMQQRVEILKMLYRDADILIFDEPTAVLTPQEIDELMQIMRNLAAEGKSIILITHKLDEIKAVASKCTIIRRGKLVGVVDVASTSVADMAAAMVGRPVSFKVDKAPARIGKPILEIEHLNVLNSKKVLGVKDFSLTVHGGEIVGNDELIFDVLNGENGLPGRDFPHQRHGARLGQGAVEQFQRPGLGGVAADEAFLFQLRQVHMHRRRGAQAHGSAYLAHRGGIALGLDLAADKVQYLLLVFS